MDIIYAHPESNIGCNCDVRANHGCWMKDDVSVFYVCGYLLCTLCVQAAHVGIGISGVEGLQASCASDYSIAQVRCGKISDFICWLLIPISISFVCMVYVFSSAFGVIIFIMWISIATVLANYCIIQRLGKRLLDSATKEG